MGKYAEADARLASLVRMAAPLCRQAERECPRKGPGRKPDIPDWVMAVLIMTAIAKRKKSKSSQYHFLQAHKREFAVWLGTDSFPARSTYFDRYRRAHRLFKVAVRLQGEKAIAEGVTDPRDVAVDKSLVAARGPLWHKSDRKRGRVPKKLRGVDCDSDWGYSQHDGWVQGYSIEVVVSCTKKTTVFPLSGSAATASARETQTFDGKIKELPESTKTVSADSGYDSNQLGERIEWNEQGKRTGKRFLCPENRRNAKALPRKKAVKPRDETHRRRLLRKRHLQSRQGKATYRRRGHTVEPFNEWFKTLFELNHHVWHRGLDNNLTQLMAAIFCYQLLVRYNHRLGNHNGQVTWILDML